jgi:hypothetical protein
MKTPKEVFEWVRLFGTEQDKEKYRVLYKHIVEQDKKIKKLEAIHDKHMAPQFFDKETAIQQQIELNRKRLEEKDSREPLKVRLKRLYKNEAIDSKEWNAICKWNRLTPEQAIKIATED